MDIEHLLTSFEPYNEQEAMDRVLFLTYIANFNDVFKRSNLFGHITCSPWIVNQDNTKVLMMFHNIYNSWGWCGGHCDGDQDVLHVALKKGKEESGFVNLQLVSNELLSLEILPVPSHRKHGYFVSAHVHLNLTFLCQANDQDEIKMKLDENSGVKWIAIEDIDSYVCEKGMLPIYHKLVDKVKHLGCFSDNI